MPNQSRKQKYSKICYKSFEHGGKNMSAKLVLTVKDSSRMAKDYSMSMMDKMFHPLKHNYMNFDKILKCLHHFPTLF